MIAPSRCADAAFVTRRVAGLAGRQRAKAQRREQLRLDGVDDAARALAVEQRERQPADGEDLVRAQGGVVQPG